MLRERGIEAFKNHINKPVERPKLHGAIIPISLALLEEMMPVKGEIAGALFDTISRSLKLYYRGDEKHFPEIPEGCCADEGNLMCRVEDGEVVECTLLIRGKEFDHSETLEVRKHGREKNKEEDCKQGEERNFCKDHPDGECPRRKGDCEGCRFKKEV